MGEEFSNSGGALIIATQPHRQALEAAFLECGLDVSALQLRRQLLLLDAAETLSKFMKDGIPDPSLFRGSVGALVEEMAKSYPSVSAYGEMVGILWDEGNVNGTILLEQLWDDFSRQDSFSLLCGYDSRQFNRAKDGIYFDQICGHHSHVIPAGRQSHEGHESGHHRVIARLQQRERALEHETEEREKAERELRESESALNDFFENAIVGLHWVNAEGTILRANRAELDMLGYSRDEYVGRNIAEFYASQEEISSILARLKSGETLRDFPVRLKCKDGSLKHALVSSNAYWKNGKFVHTRCFTRDVTDQVKAEAELKNLQTRQAEDKFRLIIESVRDYAIFMLDPNGNIASWNEGAKRIKGYEDYEVIGSHFSRFYTPEDIARGHPAEELAIAAREGRFEEEGWRVRKDGKRFWANVIISRITDESGKLLGFAKVTRDLSERKSAEQAKLEEHRRAVALEQVEQAVQQRTRELKESQAFLDSVIENIPNMVFVKSARDLRFVRLNKAGEELLGISRHELIGKNDHDLFPREEADHFVAKDREVLSGREILDVAEETIETKHQGSRILHTRKIPIFGADGRPDYLLGISEDITQRKKAEAERLRLIREQADIEGRKRENERATFLAEASTALAGSLDYHKTFKDLAELVVPSMADWCTIIILRDDKSKERIAAAHRDPEKNHLIEELARFYPAHAVDHTGIGGVIQSKKSLFTPVVSDAALAAAAKDERHLALMRALACSSCMVVPIMARGEALGAISFVSNQEDRRYDENDLAVAEELGRRAGIAIENASLYESAQKAIRTRDEFMSIASHELKTPLTSLKLQVQLRDRDYKKGNMRRFSPENIPRLIAEDEKQVNRLVRLVEDMLDVSRINTGKLSLAGEDFELSEMAKDTLSRFAAQVEASGASVSLNVIRPVKGHWDRFRLEQVLTNLLTNALKYGAGKPIEVCIDGDENRARFSVRDQGIGIDEKDQTRIFGQFERAVSATSISGMGIGLFISKKIVEAHGGSLWVESRPGSGSTFTAELPRYPQGWPN